MSLIYTLLKPMLRAVKPKRAALSREEWVRQARKIQSRFHYEPPKIPGYDVREETVGDTRCVIFSKQSSKHRKAIAYYVGGGYIRYQLPNKKSIKHYIDETGCDMWIPFYPLFPDGTMLDAVEAAYEVHRRMIRTYEPKSIRLYGLSAGANIIVGLGKHIIQKDNELPMPGLIVAVSGCNMYIAEDSRKRMDLLDKTDVLFPGDQMKLFKPIFDPSGTLPRYIAGCAAEDDYTGFPRTVLVYGGDEVMSGEAPEFEKAFLRCGMTDYEIHIEPNTFHAYPAFTFTPEGRRGEMQTIKYLKGE